MAIEVGGDVSGVVRRHAEIGHDIAGIDALRIANPCDQVHRGVRYPPCDVAALREVREVRADNRVRSREAVDRVTGPAAIARYLAGCPRGARPAPDDDVS